MFESAGVMDWSSTARRRLMKLSVFLLVSANIACLRGTPLAGDYDIYCVNDYVSTIKCILSMAPPDNTSHSNSSYWLFFRETSELESHQCMLKKKDEDYFCSVEIFDPMLDDDDSILEIFTDLDTFLISLYHKQNDRSVLVKVLDDNYEPVKNIKPNPPSCLTVSEDSNHYNFTWKSSYEKYRHSTKLEDHLMYQLHYYKRGDKNNINNGVNSLSGNSSGLLEVTPYIYRDSKNFLVDNQIFVPDTEYVARVRSIPDQQFYKGHWSDWSPEVHWKTEFTMNYLPNEFVSGLSKFFILLCVMVPLILILCYPAVKKWKPSAFIPTPALDFHTLYSECQGDFKSRVITQENTADMLRVEASLQIDTLVKCADVPEEDRHPQFHNQLLEGSTYSNIIDPVCDTSLLGIPYAVITMAPLLAPGSSLKSLTLSSQPGSPAEGDSGCWLSSDTSLEKDSPWYCNEYCTLSAVQQTGPVTAVHRGSFATKAYPQGIIKVDDIKEA